MHKGNRHHRCFGAQWSVSSHLDRLSWAGFTITSCRSLSYIASTYSHLWGCVGE